MNLLKRNLSTMWLMIKNTRKLSSIGRKMTGLLMIKLVTIMKMDVKFSMMNTILMEMSMDDRGPGKKRKIKLPVKKNKPGTSGTSEEPEEIEDEAAKKARQRSLREMFMKISEKAKKAPKLNEVEVDNDEVLNGILSNLDSNNGPSASASNSAQPAPFKPCKAFRLEKKSVPRMVSEQGTSTKSPGNLTAASTYEKPSTVPENDARVRSGSPWSQWKQCKTRNVVQL